MGKAAKTASDGGAYPGDGGTRDASAVRRRGREARPAAQHTAARRGVRTRHTFTVTSPLSGKHKLLSLFPNLASLGPYSITLYPYIRSICNSRSHSSTGMSERVG